MSRVITNPRAILFFLSHLEWAEPFTNLFAALDNYMVAAMHALDLAMQRQQNITTNGNNNNRSWSPDSAPPSAYLSAVERHKRFARDIMPFMHAVSQHLSSPAFFLPGENTTTVSRFTQAYEEEIIIENVVAAAGSGRRKLLQANATGLDWKQRLGITEPLTDGIGAVQAYSALVIAGLLPSIRLPPQFDWIDSHTTPPLQPRD